LTFGARAESRTPSFANFSRVARLLQIADFGPARSSLSQVIVASPLAIIRQDAFAERTFFSVPKFAFFEPSERGFDREFSMFFALSARAPCAPPCPSSA
jgi:hypothetical protein